RVIVGTTQDQRRRPWPCFHTSASQRFQLRHSAASVSGHCATCSIQRVLWSTCTSMPSSSKCCTRSATSSSSRASCGVAIALPQRLDVKSQQSIAAHEVGQLRQPLHTELG